jgi:hypothetical protein
MSGATDDIGQVDCYDSNQPFSGISGGGDCASPPSCTVTPTPTNTATPAITPTITPTPTPDKQETPTPTPFLTITPSATPTLTPTRSGDFSIFSVTYCCDGISKRWVILPTSTSLGTVIVGVDNECYEVQSIDPQTVTLVWSGISFDGCEACNVIYPC